MCATSEEVATELAKDYSMYLHGPVGPGRPQLPALQLSVTRHRMNELGELQNKSVGSSSLTWDLHHRDNYVSTLMREAKATKELAVQFPLQHEGKELLLDARVLLLYFPVVFAQPTVPIDRDNIEKQLIDSDDDEADALAPRDVTQDPHIIVFRNGRRLRNARVEMLPFMTFGKVSGLERQNIMDRVRKYVGEWGSMLPASLLGTRTHTHTQMPLCVVVTPVKFAFSSSLTATSQWSPTSSTFSTLLPASQTSFAYVPLVLRVKAGPHVAHTLLSFCRTTCTTMTARAHENAHLSRGHPGGPTGHQDPPKAPP